MAYFGNLYTGVSEKLSASKGLAENVLKGQFSGALREGNAATSMAAQRGGYSGSPVEAALKRKFAGQIAGQQGQALQGLESNYQNQLAGLQTQTAQLSAQEEMNKDIAQTQMWGNIIGGAGSIFGGITKLLSGGVKNG